MASAAGGERRTAIRHQGARELAHAGERGEVKRARLQLRARRTTGELRARCLTLGNPPRGEHNAVTPRTELADETLGPEPADEEAGHRSDRHIGKARQVPGASEGLVGLRGRQRTTRSVPVRRTARDVRAHQASRGGGALGGCRTPGTSVRPSAIACVYE